MYGRTVSPFAASRAAVSFEFSGRGSSESFRRGGVFSTAGDFRYSGSHPRSLGSSGARSSCCASGLAALLFIFFECAWSWRSGLDDAVSFQPARRPSQSARSISAPPSRPRGGGLAFSVPLGHHFSFIIESSIWIPSAALSTISPTSAGLLRGSAATGAFEQGLTSQCLSASFGPAGGGGGRCSRCLAVSVSVLAAWCSPSCGWLGPSVGPPHA